MLGILSIVSLVVGAFVAGGGAFDWAFLFSDGYREHDWVRNVGRSGARGLLMLLGGVLIVVGFVGQVVDVAAQPVVLATRADGARDKTGVVPPPSSGSAVGSHSTETAKKGPVSGPQLPPKTSPQASNSQAESRPGANDGPPPHFAGKYQPMTIWKPEMYVQGAEATMRLQYRFEQGYEPVPGAEYVWQIVFPGRPIEVGYDTLQSEGGLEFLVDFPQPENNPSHAWSTALFFKSDGNLKQLSNRLEIGGGQVRSIPLPTP